MCGSEQCVLISMKTSAEGSFQSHVFTVAPCNCAVCYRVTKKDEVTSGAGQSKPLYWVPNQEGAKSLLYWSYESSGPGETKSIPNSLPLRLGNSSRVERGH